MPTVELKQSFDISARDLWRYIGDFGDTGKWSGRPKDACIQEGEGIGALRTLRTADGREIVDRLEAMTDHSYTYSVVSGELPYEHYRATMSVEALADGSSLFTWRGEFEPKGISEEQAIEFTQKIYAMGIGLMQDNLPPS